MLEPEGTVGVEYHEASEMSAGEHAVRISKKGFKLWERKLTVSGGNASVNAELEEEK